MNTSLFSKILDFSSRTNQFTLSEFLKTQHLPLEKEKIQKKQIKISKEEVEFMSPDDELYNAELFKKYYDTFIKVNNIDVSNLEMINIPDVRYSDIPQPIIASYINKTKHKIDDKFRLISPREQIITQQELAQHLIGESAVDARHIKSGMVCGSFQKPILQIIAKYDLDILNTENYNKNISQEIKSEQELKSSSIHSLCKIFEKILTKSEMKKDLILHPVYQKI